MTRLLLSALTSFTLFLAPAPPAQAQEADLGQLLTGLAVLGVVGASLQERILAAREPALVPAHAKTTSRVPDNSWDRPRTRDEDWQVYLPRECARRVEDHGRQRLVYSKGCLDSVMRRADRLPRACETRVHAFGRDRVAYDAPCLRRAGWSPAPRRP